MRIALLAVAFTCLSLVSQTDAGIDAVRGRKYKITKKHGPWMIKVATFHTPPKDRRGKGMTPLQAADELVYELRKKGIPAYAFKLGGHFNKVRATDRTGQAKQRFEAYRWGVAVLAGNYPSPKDRLAKSTLEYVKKFRPRFLSDVEGKKVAKDGSTLVRSRDGGVFRSTPGRPDPFSRAHFTPNPLLSRDEINARSIDPLLVKLNTGDKHSLLNNPGKYTLILKSFYGKSVTGVDGSGFSKRARNFKTGTTIEKIGAALKITESLDRAGINAWELAVALRKYERVQAWVYHDHHKSVVTIGSFDSPNDPRIRALIKKYGAEYSETRDTRRRVLVGKGLTIPPKLRPGQKPFRQWVYDPKPRLMLVPKSRR